MKKLLLLLAALGGVLGAEAYWTPLQMNLVDEAGIPWNADAAVVRANLVFGDIGTMAGVDMGLVNLVRTNAYGVRAGFINCCEGAVQGVSLGFANTEQEDSNVIDLGFGNLGTGEHTHLRGVQVGVVNAAPYFDGVQVGFLQGAGDTVTGLGVGVVNGTRVLRGVQIGVLNSAEEAHGVQIGLVCHCANSPLMPYMPFFNFGWEKVCEK